MKKVLKMIGRFIWAICSIPVSVVWFLDMVVVVVIIGPLVWAVKGNKFNWRKAHTHLGWIDRLFDLIGKKLE